MKNQLITFCCTIAKTRFLWQLLLSFWDFFFFFGGAGGRGGAGGEVVELYINECSMSLINFIY